jgi:hypothetical protein
LRKRHFVIFFCLSLFWTATALGTDGPATDPNVQTAAGFIDMLDRDDYNQAWANTSPLFQALHNLPNWQRQQQTIRNAYGTRTDFEYRRLGYRTTYASSPDGSYCIVQFNSSFQNKAVTAETVVLIKQPTGNWLVREYVLR